MCQNTIAEIRQARLDEERQHLEEHLQRANSWRKALRFKLLTIDEMKAILLKEPHYPMYDMYYGKQEQIATTLLNMAQKTTEPKVWISAADFRAIS